MLRGPHPRSAATIALAIAVAAIPAAGCARSPRRPAPPLPGMVRRTEVPAEPLPTAAQSPNGNGAASGAATAVGGTRPARDGGGARTAGSPTGGTAPTSARSGTGGGSAQSATSSTGDGSGRAGGTSPTSAFSGTGGGSAPGATSSTGNSPNPAGGTSPASALSGTGGGTIATGAPAQPAAPENGPQPPSATPSGNAGADSGTGSSALRASGRTLTMTATAYGPSRRDNYPYGAVDYFGKPLKPGDVAVDPRIIPLGTRLYISGYRSPYLPRGGFQAVARDEGAAIKGRRIDIFIDAGPRAVGAFGIQRVRVTVLGRPPAARN